MSKSTNVIFIFLIFAKVRAVQTKDTHTDTHTETDKPIAIGETLQICIKIEQEQESKFHVLTLQHDVKDSRLPYYIRKEFNLTTVFSK